MSTKAFRKAFQPGNHQSDDVSTGRHPQSGEFRRLLDAADMTQAAFATVTGTHPNTVSRWATGATEAPGVALAYLRLVAELTRLINTMRFTR